MDDLEYYKNICKVQSCILSFVGIEVGCRAMNWNDGGFPLFRRHMLNHVCGAYDVKRILSLSNLTRDRALTLGFYLSWREPIPSSNVVHCVHSSRDEIGRDGRQEDCLQGLDGGENRGFGMLSIRGCA